jgi:predicted nuclease of predicted toxin-antitoxin system
MPHGLLKNGRSTSPTHETAGRHESVAPLGRLADAIPIGGGALVKRRQPPRTRPGNHAYAAKHDYVVLTNDLDFGAILAVTHGEKPSVVQIRSENLSPDVIGGQTINALRQLADQLNEGALVNVDPLRTRVRLLPLK